MARTRSSLIRESVEELETLRLHFQQRPAARSLLFLRFLAEDHNRTISDAAGRAGMAKRTAERIWRTYRERGINGVVKRKGSQKMSFSGRNEMPTLNSVHDSAFIDLMNSAALLPRLPSTPLKIDALKSAIGRMFPQADHISVVIRSTRNSTYSRVGIVDSRELQTAFVRQHFPDGERYGDCQPSDFDRDEAVERLLKQAARNGFPVERYQTPIVQNCMMNIHGLNEPTYVGSVFLFRELEKSPFSATVPDLLARLEPFLAHMFITINDQCSLVRQAEKRPDPAKKTDLTNSEVIICSLILEGLSFREIAEARCVSLNTVRSHAHSIYRKCGVRDRIELIIRGHTDRSYFAGMGGGEE